MRLNSRVAAVTARRVVLADGSGIEANTLVTTIGNAPNPVAMDLCRQLGIQAPKGRIPTDAAMRVPGVPSLWAAGTAPRFRGMTGGKQSPRRKPPSSRSARESSWGKTSTGP